MTCSKPSYIPIDLKIETPLQNQIITSTNTVTHITNTHYSIRWHEGLEEISTTSFGHYRATAYSDPDFISVQNERRAKFKI